MLGNNVHHQTSKIRDTNNAISSTIIASLTTAIRKGIHNLEGYPFAYIQQPAFYIAIKCHLSNTEDIENFDKFLEIFPYLCQKHQIPSLGENVYFKKTVPANAPELIKYEFLISPQDLENLLLNENSYYRGYRNRNGAGTLIHLIDPTYAALKEDVICLFPVYPLSDNTFMLRNAGCNLSETISTQLAYYIQRYIQQEQAGISTINQCYGHHSARLTEDYVQLQDEELFGYSLQILRNNEKRFRQSEEGFTEIIISPNHLGYVVPMDDKSQRIYLTLSAVPPDELKNLHSLEMPVIEYLSCLRTIISTEISNILENAQKTGNFEELDVANRFLRAQANIESLINNIIIAQQIAASQKEIDLLMASLALIQSASDSNISSEETASFAALSRQLGSPLHQIPFLPDTDTSQFSENQQINESTITP